MIPMGLRPFPPPRARCYLPVLCLMTLTLHLASLLMTLFCSVQAQTFILKTISTNVIDVIQSRDDQVTGFRSSLQDVRGRRAREHNRSTWRYMTCYTTLSFMIMMTSFQVPRWIFTLLRMWLTNPSTGLINSCRTYKYPDQPESVTSLSETGSKAMTTIMMLH